MLTPQQQQNLLDAAAAAKQSASKISAPEQARAGLALLSISQWADESGWGYHQPGNNPFGIKAVPGQAYTRKMTVEYFQGVKTYVPQDFAAYPDLAAAFDAHGKLITTGTYFAPAWQRFLAEPEDFPGFVNGIAEHYATYPGYGPLILRIASMPQVLAAMKETQA